MKESFSTMVVIYSKQKTERLEYTLNLVFKSILNVDYLLTTNTTEYLSSTSAKINYSNEPLGDGLQLLPNQLLFENSIHPLNPDIVEFEGTKGFFQTNNSFLLFDVFASSFYIASRYEEYLFDGKTPHGRFPASESILFKNGLLKKPVVNGWAKLLAQKINDRYPELEVPTRKFRFEMTIDIDQAWAFKNKSIPVCCGAVLKSLFHGQLGDLRYRMDVLSDKKPDPFDTFHVIENTFENHPANLKFFFLLGKRSRYDKNISPKNKNLQALIKELSEKYTVGIHPSYASFGKREKIVSEIETLEKMIGKSVTDSRQHFLLMKFPETYENLIQSGITNDYTLGYAETTGFRAGLCTPFLFFNLAINTITKLIIYPLHAMDVSMKDYMKLSPEQALAETLELMEQTKQVGGTFIGLWHNESLNNEGAWKGWQDVFLKNAETGLRLENE